MTAVSLKLSVDWLIDQAKAEKAILGGRTSPDTHDAAYAHALVMAIGEIGVTKDGMYAECCRASDTQSFLRDRAAELMRDWGYVEVDDDVR